jgi:hypothetical protein
MSGGEDDPRDGEPGSLSRSLAGLALFVASAAAFAWVVRAGLERPALFAPLVGVAVGLTVWRWWSRRRMRALLRRGDIGAALLRWSEELERTAAGPAAQGTLTSIMMATALTAYGRIEEARTALEAARRGPAWEAALEHRLFLEAMLSTFEGRPDDAREALERLLALPVRGDRVLRSRIVAMRDALAALVRAFQHRSLPGDRDALERASEESPLIHWSMRYAAAIVAIDEGDQARARALIADAPRWPEQSAFRPFHEEIARMAGASEAS